MCVCVFFPLNRSLKRLSVWFQGKNLPTKNRWLERSKPEFNSSFACRFLHYGWSMHGIHTWHGTNKQKCTSQWEFSYSLIFPSLKKKQDLEKLMSIIFNYTSLGPLKHIQFFILAATWPSSARIHSSRGVVVSALRGPSEVLPRLCGW